MRYEVVRQDKVSKTAIFWEWPSSTGEWSQTDDFGVGFGGPGHLTETGRGALLEHFGLASLAGQLDCYRISLLSPKQLLAMRKQLEQKDPSLPKLDLASGGRNPVHADAVGP